MFCIEVANSNSSLYYALAVDYSISKIFLRVKSASILPASWKIVVSTFQLFQFYFKSWFKDGFEYQNIYSVEFLKLFPILFQIS